MDAKIAFRHELDFEYGVVAQVSPLIRRVVARNPSPFTLYGTGTYIVGHGRVAVIDPGPDLADHIEALMAALEGEEISHVLVTHTHQDHSPACRAVQHARQVKTFGYGPHGAGKWEEGVQVEEGGDMTFVPDVEVRHGDVIEGDGWTIECAYTPGHTSNHMCFAMREERALFSGDHVMGWSTSVISPPDGDMAHYMSSLDRLLMRDDDIYWPTHGPPITEPKEHVQGFIAHRLGRERQIVACIEDGIDTIAAMVPAMYRDVPAHLHPAAARSVFAAVIHMVERGDLTSIGPLAIQSRYRLPA